MQTNKKTLARVRTNKQDDSTEALNGKVATHGPLSALYATRAVDELREPASKLNPENGSFSTLKDLPPLDRSYPRPMLNLDQSLLVLFRQSNPGPPFANIAPRGPSHE